MARKGILCGWNGVLFVAGNGGTLAAGKGYPSGGKGVPLGLEGGTPVAERGTLAARKGTLAAGKGYPPPPTPQYPCDWKGVLLWLTYLCG